MTSPHQAHWNRHDARSLPDHKTYLQRRYSIGLGRLCAIRDRHQATLDRLGLPSCVLQLVLDAPLEVLTSASAKREYEKPLHRAFQGPHWCKYELDRDGHAAHVHVFLTLEDGLRLVQLSRKTRGSLAKILPAAAAAGLKTQPPSYFGHGVRYARLSLERGDGESFEQLANYMRKRTFQNQLADSSTRGLKAASRPGQAVKRQAPAARKSTSPQPETPTNCIINGLVPLERSSVAWKSGIKVGQADQSHQGLAALEILRALPWTDAVVDEWVGVMPSCLRRPGVKDAFPGPPNLLDALVAVPGPRLREALSTPLLDAPLLLRA